MAVPNTDPYASQLNVNPGAANKPNSTTTTTTGPAGSTSTTNGTQTTNSNNSSSTTNMDPESLAALQRLIAQLSGAGTSETQAEAARRKQIEALVLGLLPSVSTNQAFNDAKGLMALNLQKSMDANMPALQRSIEGAGTSASSMQGLLGQNASRDAALAASALGADQAKSYQNNQTAMLNTLEALTRPTSTQTNALLAALNIAKNATSNTNGNSSQTTNTNQTTTTDTAPTTTTTNTNYGPSTADPGSVNKGGSGLSWIDAMAQSRGSNGEVDWVKAASLLNN